MSRISETLKNKGKIERIQKQRRKEELIKLKNKTAYRAALVNELKKVDVLLDSDSIKSIEITVPEQSLSQFTESMYMEELAGYDVFQSPDNPNKFTIKYKEI